MLSEGDPKGKELAAVIVIVVAVVIIGKWVFLVGMGT